MTSVQPVATASLMAAISDHEFRQFQRFLHETAGISLSSAKKALVSGRLAKRLRDCRLDGYGDYLRLLASGNAPAEVQTAIDLLTTNQTHFFREPKHFAQLVLQHFQISLRCICT